MHTSGAISTLPQRTEPEALCLDTRCSLKTTLPTSPSLLIQPPWLVTSLLADIGQFHLRFSVSVNQFPAPPPLRGGHRAAPARHGFRRGPTRRRCGALWGRPGTARPERSRKEAVKGAAEPGRAGLGQSRAGLGRSEPSPPPSGRRPRYRLTAARGRHPLPQRLRGRLPLARSAVTQPIPGG